MEPRFEVTGFGEIMLRLSVPAGRRLEVASTFDVHPGGAEGNVLCALGSVGRKGAWIGGLPNNPMGHIVRNHLRRADVATDGIIWKDDARMGLFYIEFSGAPRGIQVHYDRADSAATKVQLEDIPWDILLNTRVIHLSGITPALSASCLSVTQEVIARAKEHGVAISFDINFRRKLWSEKRAAEVLLPLIQGVDLLFCGRTDAELLFNSDNDPEACLRNLVARSQAKNVVVSLGDAGAIAWDGKRTLHATQGPVAIVDRIGAGDAMAAGVLHGWLDGDLQTGLDTGMALAAIALSIEGDSVYTSLPEVQAILGEARQGVDR